ncbi:MAG: type I-E CRISPR-associated protein Cas7/Cse4/CasC [Actinomyces sp.]|jgi:CRISPR system Cascade subunit CasC|nr:type I-E CRISPR-associated protein Cas7/Cse4/CasC [Actinomyces sp.]MCI1642606.1 type I-E CRISPR-associated protein Cas7/Cse4/CasC [Actinomyces sp.]MCI1663158.1 type I-E CRISPR-associated protein Cas7/Cse4/CasC [Actinomyces sp.]MCI1691723.1 type I-E CRISPR-associated protein Cas7/Cse4/CasC [Actinomyces sp.]
MTRFVDIHVLQTLPPSNPNRDDTGAPKSATFGGVRRMRISSQAIKRATRKDFDDTLPKEELGVRTKRIVQVLRDEIVRQAPELKGRAANLADMAMKAIGFKTTEPKVKKGEEPSDEQLAQAGFLVFLSARQIEHVAEAVIAVADEDDPVKAFKATSPKKLVDTDHSVDIALFGRMVAEPESLNVDAACQVAHALGVGPVAPEYDYYTAVDDAKTDEEDSGAGMIGTIEFTSATLYRYATINLPMLEKNLGTKQAVQEAVKAFVDSFVRSMPTGKQNTFANRTVPDAVVVQLRDDQPINLVGAFEDVVEADGHGFVRPAAHRLVAFEKDLREGTGLLPEKTLVSWSSARAEKVGELGERVPMSELGRATVTAMEELS